jgi:hypothetical protein
MAVRAADGALCNFLSDLFPRGSITNHARDIRYFFAKVVEVQERKVLLAAVDARMLGEIVVNARGQHSACKSAVTLDWPCIRDAPDIPGSRRSALAREANPVSRTLGT